MSVVAQTVQTVQTVLSPSPSASPVVQAAHAAATVVSGETWGDLLNKVAGALSPYVVVIGAVLATSVQSLLNKLPWLSHDVAAVQDLRRKLLAVVLPVAGTLLAGLATGQNTLSLAPWVFLAAQVLFATVKALQSAGTTLLDTPVLAVDAPPEG